jgi:hypothetical protein
VSVAQTTQLLHLLLNAALVLLIALIWWGVVLCKLNTVSTQMQRLRRQYQPGNRAGTIDIPVGLPQLRRRRHDLWVRYRLTRHSALIMHYVLLTLMASLFCLALRSLVSSNLLITVSMFLFVLGAFGLLLSVTLALMEFYQMALLEDSAAPRIASSRYPHHLAPRPSTHQDVVVEVDSTMSHRDAIAS